MSGFALLAPTYGPVPAREVCVPTFREILVVLLLKLLPLVVLYVLACKWLFKTLAVPSQYSFWINFIGVLLIAKVVAGPLLVRLHRADRMKEE